jgi:sugar transferase (PEP-CTERM/EpsH1 system associated)
MRILFICHRIPYPPNKGDKIRAFHELRALSERHEVDLFTLADKAEDLSEEQSLKPYCSRIHVARLDPKMAKLKSLRFLFGRCPLTVPYFHSTALHRAVRAALRNRSYERIFVYCSAMAQYVTDVKEIPVLTDLVDVDSNKWMQYAAHTPFPLSAIFAREARFLAAYERTVCQRSVAVLVSTEREAELARGISPRVNVHVVTNGVDTDYFKGPTETPRSFVPAVVFVGDMGYFPNEEAARYFARTVLPMVRASIGDVRFLIVGRNPSRATRRLQEIPGVQVTGFVPDIRTYLAQAQVAVAPFSIAAGIQNKILEAMAFGLPIVATPRVLQGLSPRVAALIETGNTPEELATHVRELLANPQIAECKGIEGRRRVTEEYNWKRPLAQLLELVGDPMGAPFNFAASAVSGEAGV